ncbi:hypothetical protein CY34DRAFT_813183 [Suillus luteus UH-Slu-Lm8-n1]|uniref:Uncharacterized protein n=1 Tax=Suillus luteus UH-Slu-Lm8-n1 TaxID=930992 RepID=A0A0C9ZXD2_9AGAM|nr:hypothetical protein CY34DRAFT_813183 [Suillus luteus UH-Slu-Lm8-n1]
MSHTIIQSPRVFPPILAHPEIYLPQAFQALSIHLVISPVVSLLRPHWQCHMMQFDMTAVGDIRVSFPLVGASEVRAPAQHTAVLCCKQCHQTSTKSSATTSVPYTSR